MEFMGGFQSFDFLEEFDEPLGKAKARAKARRVAIAVALAVAARQAREPLGFAMRHRALPPPG